MTGRNLAEKLVAVPMALVLALGMLPAAAFGALAAAFPQHAHADESGTWHGVSYDITYVENEETGEEEGTLTFHAGTFDERGEDYSDEEEEYDGWDYDLWTLGDDDFENVTAVRADGRVVLPANSSWLFYKSSDLQSVDMANFDSSRVTTFSHIFASCPNLKSLNLTGLDTSQAMSMRSMFLDTPVLESITLGSTYTFNGSTSSRLPDSSFHGGFWTSSADGKSYAADEIPNNTAATYTYNAGQEDTWHGVKFDINETTGALVFHAGTMTGDFTNEPLAGAIRDRLDSMDVSDSFEVTTIVADGKVVLPANSANLYAGLKKVETIDLSNFDFSRVTSAENMFYGCSKLRSLNLSGADTSEIVNMKGMFAECPKLPSLDIASFDTSNVTDMQDMFNGCRAITSLDLSGFNTSHATDMSGMFALCEKLKSVDITGFDTSSVTNMSDMFAECEKLRSLDVSNLDTSHVRDFASMFEDCVGIKNLDLSSFTTSKVRDMNMMFAYCEGLKILNLSSFDTTKTSVAFGMFFDCPKLEKITVGPKYVFKQRKRAFGSAQLNPFFPTGNWRSSVSGKIYRTSTVPDKVAATYTKVPDEVLSQLVDKRKTVAVYDKKDDTILKLRQSSIRGKEFVEENRGIIYVTLEQATKRGSSMTAMARKRKVYKPKKRTFKKTFKIPERLHRSGYTLIIVEIAPKAFWGAKGMKTIVVPSQIERMGKNAFGKCTANKLQLRTKKLNGSYRVQSCLKKSKVKTVKVSVGSKKRNKQYQKKYKKVFKKKTVGKKVKVTR